MGHVWIFQLYNSPNIKKTTNWLGACGRLSDGITYISMSNIKIKIKKQHQRKYYRHNGAQT